MGQCDYGKDLREKNYKVTFILVEYWEGGYNANVEIENTGDTTIENWMLEFSYTGSISNIWNAVISKHTGNSYLIKNVVWNQDIASGKSVSFGISGQENFPGFPVDCQIRGNFESVAGEDYIISYYVNSEWDNGFNSEIILTNNTNTTLEDWVLEFDFDRTITNIWNGVIENHEENHYVIKNAGYNSNIPALGTVSFDFNGQGGEKEDEPSGFRLYSYTENSESDISDKEKILTINMDNLIYNENAGWYIVNKKMDSLTGTMSTPEKVKELSCEVTDIKGNKVLSCSIDMKKNWKLEDFGLSIGYNKVTVMALLNSGNKVMETIELINYESSNLDGINVDMLDSDGDGLCNYYEDILGTDKNKMDTDGDGLSDYDEFLRTGTDPLFKDTDNNGVTDDEEDMDEDGLDNLTEIKQGTNCLLEDTDEDGLKDGEEVIVYHTNPLLTDTDMDGLSDWEDKKLGFDPTKPDTDENGVLDGKEKIMQICTQKIETDEKEGIMEVSVGLMCDGYIDNQVSIMNTYDLDMRSSDVVGLVGVPVEISTDIEFKSADITFTYDEDALGDSNEDDLCMMWYDEENDNYVLLEDSVLDKKNNTITYNTTHFSTYLVVDRQIWLDNLRMAPNYDSSEGAVYYDIAFTVDVSLSMQSGKRLPMAKDALNAFIDAMLPGDRAGLIKFNKSASVVCGLTEEKELLKTGVESLSLKYGNSVAAGIQAGLLMLDETGEEKEKIIILICDGDVDNCTALVQKAVEKNIKIYCINVQDGNAKELEDIAKNTGGLYYYAATSEDIRQAVSDLQGDTIESVNMTDSDGDGLYDIYETSGMCLSNGQIVYTDPNKADTDEDGINDYDAMGGDPVIESYMIGDDVYSCTLFHSVVYGKLSKQFIYVDGTLNDDGKQYFEKMDYVPYSNRFLYQKYNIKRGEYSEEEDYKPSFSFDEGKEERYTYGDARMHCLFADYLDELTPQKKVAYAAENTLIAVAIALVTVEPYGFSTGDPQNQVFPYPVPSPAISLTWDPMAEECFLTYISGNGGEEAAWESEFTRKNISAKHCILKGMTSINSAKKHLDENIGKTMKAVEGVLNQYNTEVYLSVSPDKKMSGCLYADVNEKIDLSTVASVVNNISAFGTFNNADAGITLHCVYNSDTEEYTMNFKYCLIDYYDFPLTDGLKQQDMLGLAQGYELYGWMEDSVTWKKGEEKHFYDSWFEKLVNTIWESTGK